MRPQTYTPTPPRDPTQDGPPLVACKRDAHGALPAIEWEPQPALSITSLLRPPQPEVTEISLAEWLIAEREFGARRAA